MYLLILSPFLGQLGNSWVVNLVGGLIRKGHLDYQFFMTQGMKSLFYTSMHTISADMPVLHTRSVGPIVPDPWREEEKVSYVATHRYCITEFFLELFFLNYILIRANTYSSVSLNSKPRNWLKKLCTIYNFSIFSAHLQERNRSLIHES